MSEDLAAIRANLAYAARLAKKEGKINETWTNNGKVFVKERQDSKPKRVNKVSEIPNI